MTWRKSFFDVPVAAKVHQLCSVIEMKHRRKNVYPKSLSKDTSHREIKVRDTLRGR
jgi:hypothetical protein